MCVFSAFQSFENRHFLHYFWFSQWHCFVRSSVFQTQAARSNIQKLKPIRRAIGEPLKTVSKLRGHLGPPLLHVECCMSFEPPWNGESSHDNDRFVKIGKSRNFHGPKWSQSYKTNFKIIATFFLSAAARCSPRWHRFSTGWKRYWELPDNSKKLGNNKTTEYFSLKNAAESDCSFRKYALSKVYHRYFRYCKLF